MGTEGHDFRVVAGRYRLRARIGRGGMGVVWRAEDEVLGRLVAVKEIVQDDSAPDADARLRRERTFREARAVAQLHHPHIIVVHDVVEQDERPYIVMELIDGGSLADRIAERGPLTPEEAARIGADLLSALSTAHAAGVLHRDIKPANVLVESGTDRAVLTDFGIARVAGATTLTETGSFVGSPEYTAPERMSGLRSGPAADLWSLGALLCTALSGESPFRRHAPRGRPPPPRRPDHPPPPPAAPPPPPPAGRLGAPRAAAGPGAPARDPVPPPIARRHPARRRQRRHPAAHRGRAAAAGHPGPAGARPRTTARRGRRRTHAAHLPGDGPHAAPARHPDPHTPAAERGPRRQIRRPPGPYGRHPAPADRARGTPGRRRPRPGARHEVAEPGCPGGRAAGRGGRGSRGVGGGPAGAPERRRTRRHPRHHGDPRPDRHPQPLAHPERSSDPHHPGRSRRALRLPHRPRPGRVLPRRAIGVHP
ncbi:serine/threonine-protein kinase [Streptomyces sp. NPDC059597]|uniref:serine/threonine-protein kinase n=1 Tax=Streptomyces sp. NPDC059597 TaxID=3346879 RepID=UPI0036ADFD2E